MRVRARYRARPKDFRPSLACKQKWFAYDVDICGISLCGQLLANVDGGREHPHQTLFWYGELKPRVLLKAWVEHLLRNTLAQSGVQMPVITDLIGGEDPAHHSIRFAPVPDAIQVLEPLVHLYLRGLACLCAFCRKPRSTTNSGLKKTSDTKLPSPRSVFFRSSTSPKVPILR